MAVRLCGAPPILTAVECSALADLYDHQDGFRKRVIMAQHNFGVGEYKYLSYPLPEVVDQLRASLYARLAPIATRWEQALGREIEYPETLEDFLRSCHAAGQDRPTPLLLQYEQGATTACTRICTATSGFHCKSPDFSVSLELTSTAESFSWWSSGRGRNPSAIRSTEAGQPGDIHHALSTREGNPRLLSGQRSARSQFDPPRESVHAGDYLPRREVNRSGVPVGLRGTQPRNEKCKPIGRSSAFSSAWNSSRSSSSSRRRRPQRMS